MRMRINGEAADIVIMIWMKTEDGDHDNHDNYDDDDDNYDDDDKEEGSPLADWHRWDCVCLLQFLINPDLHDGDEEKPMTQYCHGDNDDTIIIIIWQRKMRKKDNHDVRHCLILSSVSTLLSFLSHITHHCDQCQLFS